MQRILIAFLVIGAIALALKVAVILALIALLVALFTRPQETLGLAALAAIYAGFTQHPWIALSIVAIMGLTSFVLRAQQLNPPDDD